MAGGTRYQPRRGRGAAACVLTLAVVSAAAWWGLETTPHRDQPHPGPTPRPAALVSHTTPHDDEADSHAAAAPDLPHTAPGTSDPTRVGTMTGDPARRPGNPTSRLPQTSGAAATLLLSALAILTLSAAYRVASAADRRDRYQPRHRRIPCVPHRRTQLPPGRRS